MKKSEREWLQMLLDDPKLRKAWLKHEEEQKLARQKEHFAMVKDTDENDD